MTKLLIVDDEQNVRYSLEKALSAEGRSISTAGTAGDAILLVRQDPPDVVLLDIRLPDMSGLDAFEEIHKIDSHLPVVMITAHGTTETAIEAMKRGAFEYLLKPVDVHELRAVVANAIELSRLSRVQTSFDQRPPVDTRVDRIVGLSPAMQKVYKDIGRVAPEDVNVLILGESGTGKELVARAIYQHSRRADKPFLAINCAAIPEMLLESEVFGHERGSFTGADRRRIGKFEQADQGTILLDEIGDMTLATQAKILRLLQDGRFERVGGNKTIETDVRVIAATNQDLEALIADSRFRQDLFYRLKVFSVVLPPLRQRAEDLPMLVEHFLTLFCRELGKNVPTVTDETMHLLKSYHWPGNVRELQGTLKYAMINAQGGVIVPEHLPEVFHSNRPHKTAGGAKLDVLAMVRQLLDHGRLEIYQTVREAVDRAVFEEVLNHCRGNQVEASRLLGISRTTLHTKLNSLGLALEKQVRSDSGHPDQAVNGH